jgi:hypothetical protein
VRKIKSPPKTLSYGPYRKFKVTERFGKRCIVLSTKTENYVMYWNGDYLRLDRFLLWLSKAVAWVDIHGNQYDFKEAFLKRNKRHEAMAREANERLRFNSDGAAAWLAREQKLWSELQGNGRSSVHHTTCCLPDRGQAMTTPNTTERDRLADVPKVLLRCSDGFDVIASPDPPGSVGCFPKFKKQYFVPLWALQTERQRSEKLASEVGWFMQDGNIERLEKAIAEYRSLREAEEHKKES